MESREKVPEFDKRTFLKEMDKKESGGDSMEGSHVRLLRVDMCAIDDKPGFSFSVKGTVLVTGQDFISIRITNILEAQKDALIGVGDEVELLLGMRSFEGSTGAFNELPITIHDAADGQMKAQRRAFVRALDIE